MAPSITRMHDACTARSPFLRSRPRPLQRRPEQRRDHLAPALLAPGSSWLQVRHAASGRHRCGASGHHNLCVFVTFTQIPVFCRRCHLRVLERARFYSRARAEKKKQRSQTPPGCDAASVQTLQRPQTRTQRKMQKTAPMSTRDMTALPPSSPVPWLAHGALPWTCCTVGYERLLTGCDQSRTRAGPCAPPARHDGRVLWTLPWARLRELPRCQQVFRSCSATFCII